MRRPDTVARPYRNLTGFSLCQLGHGFFEQGQHPAEHVVQLSQLNLKKTTRHARAVMARMATSPERRALAGDRFNRMM